MLSILHVTIYYSGRNYRGKLLGNDYLSVLVMRSLYDFTKKGVECGLLTVMT